MLTYPFTRDRTFTTPRRHMLERLFVNSDPRCTFLPRTQIKLVLEDYAMYLLSLFNTNAMCMAPKHSGIQAEKLCT